MPSETGKQRPKRESLLFFTVFAVLGIAACAFPVFIRILGAGWAVFFAILRPFLIVLVLVWCAWVFWRWLKK